MTETQRTVIILGAKGMLGQALTEAFVSGDSPWHVLAWDREEIDITDFPKLKTELAAVRPDLVINAAAYNAVDLCETDDAEYAKALLLNRDVPTELGRLAQEQGFALVHYSTDYVFDGAAKDPIVETTEPKPLSRYGTSKHLGEQGVLASMGKVYLIRLSKLFGKPAASAAGKRSFFEVMEEKGRSTDAVQVVDAERSAFTFAPDLAQATRALIEDNAEVGIYHLINEGAVTWYEGVLELYQQLGLTTTVTPVPSTAFPRPAKRPAYSCLANTKRPLLRHYREALADFLRSKHPA